MEDIQIDRGRLTISAPVFDTLHNKLIYAIKPTDREFTSNLGIFPHILEDEKIKDEKGRFKCTKCNELVHPSRPTKKRWYFSHYPGTKCNGDDEVEITGESDLHKFAKFILYEKIKQGMPLTIIGASCNTPICNRKLDSHNVIYDEASGDIVEIEYTIDDARHVADVAIVNNGIVKYIFEILNTNKTLSRPAPWFEIKATEIMNKKDETCIMILTDVKYYLCGSCPQRFNTTEIVIDAPQCRKINIDSVIKLAPEIDDDKLYITIRDIAKELGYISISYPYACESRRLIDMAMTGKYKIETEHWYVTFDKDDKDKKRINILWEDFISRKKCMRCERTHITSWGKPFCKSCFIQTKEEELDSTPKYMVVNDQEKDH